MFNDIESLRDKDSVSVGDFITVRPVWGTGDPETVIVTGLEVTEHPRTKYGHRVKTVDVRTIHENRCLISYHSNESGDSWCYSSQVHSI